MNRMLRNHITDVVSSNSASLLAYFERRVERDDAADLLAETMSTAWRRADALPADEVDARMWLFGVARNVLANAQRSELRRWRLADRLRLMIHHESGTSAADSGVEVRDAVDRLPSELGELIRLVHWDGFTVAEAAMILSMPASTARGRYQRAKELLREALAVVEPTSRE